MNLSKIFLAILASEWRRLAPGAISCHDSCPVPGQASFHQC